MTDDIRLYTLDFNLVAIIHRIKSSSWEIYYNKIGTFEAHLKIDKVYTEAILNNEFLIATEGNKQAFVTAKQINNEIILYGRTLNFLLSKRCVMPFDTETDGITNNPVIVCNRLIEDVFIKDRNVTAPDGGTYTLPGVDNMIVTDNSGLFDVSDEIYTLSSVKALSDVITERLEKDKLGHRLVFDVKNKQWIFQVLCGSTLQIVLSEGNRNFYETDYTSDIQDKADGGFFEVTVEKTDTVTDEATNEKEYRFIKKSGFDSVIYPICIWETPLTGSEESDAQRNLDTHKSKEEITGAVERLKFGNDYELGDILRIQFFKNDVRKTFYKRISGVKIYRESNEETVEPILEE